MAVAEVRQPALRSDVDTRTFSQRLSRLPLLLPQHRDRNYVKGNNEPRKRNAVTGFISTDTRNGQAARALLNYLASPEAAPVYRSAKMFAASDK